MFYVTTPAGDTRNCETRKEAAAAAQCSVGRIGEIAKGDKQSVTLRNGAIVSLVAAPSKKAAPKKATKSTYWMKDTKAPKKEVQKVVDLIKRQAMLNTPGLFKQDPDAAIYEAAKEYFCESIETEFAQQVMWEI